MEPHPLVSYDALSDTGREVKKNTCLHCRHEPMADTHGCLHRAKAERAFGQKTAANGATGRLSVTVKDGGGMVSGGFWIQVKNSLDTCKSPDAILNTFRLQPDKSLQRS